MKKLTEKKKKWIERTVANDRSNKRFLYNRMYLFALFVLLQIAGVVYIQYLFVYNSRLGAILQAAGGILAAVIVLYIINRNQRASIKIGWILLILIFPVFGVPAYIWFGEGKPARKMKNKIEKSKTENDEARAALFQDRQTPEKGLDHYLTEYAKAPAFHSGEATYYDCGEKMFPVIKEELKKAEKFILVEYFIIAHGKMWGQILEILLQKAQEGVQVRILYDDFGCMTTLPPHYDLYLESLHENIRAHSFNEVVPVFALRMNNRDHRKILVVDGKVAFTGGINLADEYIGEKRRFGYWKDTGVKITGDSVNCFTGMFFDLWNAFREDKEPLENYFSPVNADILPSDEKGITIQPYDDSPLDGRNVGEWTYVNMIDRAKNYAYVFTPYLLPDEAIRSALIRAAERGVDVRIVTPGIPDKKLIYRVTRANYPSLLEAGVKIYEYTPGFIHAKSLVCDDEYAVVGTINFDCRSLYLHFENAVYFSNCPAVLDLKRDCEETFALSRECAKENTKRGFFGRMVDSILRLFEIQM